MLAVAITQNLVDALSFAFGMFWEILWALILGFALSGAVQALVSKQEMRRLLPDDSPRPLALSQGRRLHRRDGVRVRLHQPRDRARDHHGPAPRLAVHPRRVPWRPA